MKARIIKQTAFEANGQDHTRYLVSYKGHAIVVNTLHIPAEEITVEDNNMELKGEYQLKKETYINNEGQEATGLLLMQKLDLLIV